MTDEVGVIISAQTYGETLAANQIAYLKSDGKWWKARANATATSTGEIGLVLDAGTSGRILKLGYRENPSWNWTPGAPVYLSAATAGALTQTRPGGIGNIAREIGSAVSATVIYFAPSSATGASESPRTATYVVAASDAPAHVKRQADYVCDGTDDHVEILAAIAALPAGGGIVSLTTGTFTLATTWGGRINLVSGISLRGSGAGTIITGNGIAASAVSNVEIADLHLVNIAGGHGISLANVDHGHVHGCITDNPNDDGIAISGESSASILIEGNVCKNSVNEAFVASGIECDDGAQDVIIRNNTCTGCKHGITVHTHPGEAGVQNILIEGNILYDNYDNLTREQSESRAV